MCITPLNKELNKYIESVNKPLDERGKNHSFPYDLYLAGSDELKQEFNTYINDFLLSSNEVIEFHGLCSACSSNK